MDVSVEATPGQLPRLKIANRTSYLNCDTKKHDDEATKYMSYVLFPLIVGYFIYSLVYDKHKSWCVPTEQGMRCHWTENFKPAMF